jgi:hypothetical protein
VDCEYEDDWVYDHYFETSEQVEEYAEAVLGPRDGGTLRSRKPAKGLEGQGSRLRNSTTKIPQPTQPRAPSRNGKPRTPNPEP